MVRFKRRYFCVEIQFRDSDLNSMSKKMQLNKLKHTNLSETVHKSIERFYGDLGMAKMMPSFSVIYFNMNTNMAIMRTARDLETKFHNLLTFTRKIDEFDCAFRVVHVSGSIKKCKKFLLHYCNQRLLDIYVKISNNTTNSRNYDALLKDQSDLSENDKEIINVLNSLIKVCEEGDNIFNIK
jgi:ribonuclease P/MRP protein subunit POP5